MAFASIHYIGPLKGKWKGAVSNILYPFAPGINYQIDARDRDAFLAYKGPDGEDIFCLM